MTLDGVTNGKTQFLVTKSGRVTLDPDLVTLDGVRALALEICVSVIRPFPVRDSEIPTESCSKTESSSPPQAIFLGA